MTGKFVKEAIDHKKLAFTQMINGWKSLADTTRINRNYCNEHGFHLESKSLDAKLQTIEHMIIDAEIMFDGIFDIK